MNPVKKYYSYYLKELGEELEDARELIVEYEDIHSLAEDAAKDFWYRSGWESTWPKVFTIVYNDTETDFVVDVETRPQFTASRIKK